MKHKKGNFLEFVFDRREAKIHQKLLLVSSLRACFLATFMRARHSSSHRCPIDGECSYFYRHSSRIVRKATGFNRHVFVKRFIINHSTLKKEKKGRFTKINLF